MDDTRLVFVMLYISQVLYNLQAITQSTIKGSNVVLNCTFRSTDKVVLWSRETAGLSEGTIIYDHVKPDEFRQRLSITGNHDNGEYHLTIATVKETDEGMYSCSLSGAVDTYHIQLSVIEGPSSTSIAGKTQDNKLVGTEEHDLTISCTAVGGNPPSDMVLQVKNKNYTSNGRGTIQQTLHRVGRSYDGSTVTCLAGSRSLFYFPATDTANVYLRLKPSEPVISPDTVSTEETKTLLVTCTSSGGRPRPSVKWLINNVDISPSHSTEQSIHDIAKDTYTITSSLVYSVDRNDNGKKLVCRFRNTATGDTYVSQSRNIDVKYPPSVSVENKTYNPGETSRQITCNANGNPDTYTFSKWQHRSKYGTLIRTLDGNSTLTLPQTSEDTRYQDTGEYVYIVSNGIKDKDGNLNQEATGFVVSRASPVFLSNNQQTQLGQTKHDVEIQVNIYSVPKHTSLKWLKGKILIPSSTKHTMTDASVVLTDTFHGTEIQVDGYRLTLTIHNLQEQDFGNYTLRVGNGVGQTVECMVILQSAHPPDTPLDITSIGATESTVTLQWLPAYDGGNEQTFIVEYRTSGSSAWSKAPVPKILHDFKNDLQTHTISGLQDGVFFEFRVYAENNFSQSNATDIVKVSTLGKSQSYTVTGVAIGLSTVTVISLIINGVLAYKMFTGKRSPNSKTSSSTESTDKKGCTEVYYNVVGDKDDKDLSSELEIRHYETLGSKDKPSVYEDLDHITVIGKT